MYREGFPAKDKVCPPSPRTGLASRLRQWYPFTLLSILTAITIKDRGESWRWDSVGNWKYLSASWQSERNFYWQIPVGKITAEGKCFNMGDGQWSHSERKGGGGREDGWGVRWGVYLLPIQIYELDKHGFQRTESSCWFLLPLLTWLRWQPHCIYLLSPESTSTVTNYLNCSRLECLLCGSVDHKSYWDLNGWKEDVNGPHQSINGCLTLILGWAPSLHLQSQQG